MMAKTKPESTRGISTVTKTGVRPVPPRTPPISAADRKQARVRAAEWKQFRRDYMFSQSNLADALGCTRRQIGVVESGKEVYRPHAALLRRFALLKIEQKRLFEGEVA